MSCKEWEVSIICNNIDKIPYKNVPYLVNLVFFSFFFYHNTSVEIQSNIYPDKQTSCISHHNIWTTNTTASDAWQRPQQCVCDGVVCPCHLTDVFVKASLWWLYRLRWLLSFPLIDSMRHTGCLGEFSICFSYAAAPTWMEHFHLYTPTHCVYVCVVRQNIIKYIKHKNKKYKYKIKLFNIHYHPKLWS